MRTRAIVSVLAASCLAGGCSGKKSGQPAEKTPAAASDRIEAPPTDAAPRPPAIARFEAKGAGEAAALAALGAIPVWAGVVDRGDYLARRGKRGILFGRLGDPVGKYRWFIDEEEGAGALGVRLAATNMAALERGERLVVWGAWHVDEERHWYWKAERLEKLEPRQLDLPEGVESMPGHQIVEIPKRPRGSIRVADIEEAREERDIVFEVCKTPKDPSDGWTISNRTKWKAVARLHLPGERATYGAQDLRSPGEHWRLERNTRYTVRVKPFWKPKKGLTRMIAVNAPRKITVE